MSQKGGMFIDDKMPNAPPFVARAGGEFSERRRAQMYCQHGSATSSK